MVKILAMDAVPPHSFHLGLGGSCFICNNEKAHAIHVTADDIADELDDDPVEEHTGAMVALFLDSAVAETLAIPGGEPADNLHVTLAYLGLADDLADVSAILSVVAKFAESAPPLTGVIGGIGLFTGGETPVTYATPDIPGLPSFRERLVQDLANAGVDVSSSHGYTPHITLAFADERNIEVPNIPLEFDSIAVAVAGVRTFFLLGAPCSDLLQSAGVHEPHEYVHPVADPLSGLEEDPAHIGTLPNPPCKVCGEPEGGPDHVAPKAKPKEKNVQTSGFLQVIPPATATITYTQNGPIFPRLSNGDYLIGGTQPAPEPVQTAFVAEVNGRTLITGQATVDNNWEKALNSNPHMTWIQGRFVGADAPNRNNAYWSTKDLEVGEATVRYGPLNWLHESRHIIGSIADHRLVRAAESAADGGTTQNHIAAVAGVWKWIYPDEAWVIENSSDQGRLWYSMECISENVECVGDNGCGTVCSYADYLQGNGCDHMAQRSSVRRFDNPTFLGGAVIVPPVRPGWADADARIMREASSLAEVAFEQVKPDMTANEWEAMMRQIVGYAYSK